MPRESEALYRGVVEGAHEGILIHQDGVVRYANSACARLFGYPSPEELVGQSVLKTLFSPDAWEAIRNRLERLQRGETLKPHHGWPGLRKDGTRVWIASTGSLITWQDEPAVLSFFSDITDLTNAQEKLALSEELLRTVLDDIPALVCRFRTDGTVVFVNSGWCDYFQVPRAEVIGDDVFRFMTAEQQADARRCLSALDRETRAITHVGRVIAPGGATRWVEWTCRALFDASDAVVGYQSVGHDVTERKRAEEDRKEERQKLDLALGATGMGLWTWDPMTDHIEWDDRMHAIFGLPVGRGPRSIAEYTALLAPDERAGFAQKVAAPDRLPDISAVQRRIVRPDGSTRWILTLSKNLRDEVGNLRMVVGGTLDISERHLATERLRESEERFTAAFEHAPIGSAIVSLDGRYLRVNEALCAMTGYGTAELQAMDFAQIAHPEDVAALVAAAKRLAAGHLDVYDAEHRYVRKDGDIVWVHIKARDVMDATGRPQYVMATMEDITERRRAEEGRRDSERRYRALAAENAALLEQARRDASTKSVLLQEVNHRVQNNLTSIVGLVRAHQRFTKDLSPERWATTLGDLSARIEGLAAVHRMLSAGEWSALDAGDLGREVIDVAVRQLSPSRRATLAVECAGVSVTAHQASSLALILNELATNSIKHMEDRRTVHISVRVTTQDDRIRIEYRDDGPGYPEAALAPGTRSMGLYLVDNLVRKSLRGHVRLRNDSGAVAELTFPRGDSRFSHDEGPSR